MLKNIKNNFFIWVAGGLAIYSLIISVANIGIITSGVYLRAIVPVGRDSMGVLMLYCFILGMLSGFFFGIGLLKRKKDAGIPQL